MLTRNYSGKIGKTIVFKRHRDGDLATKYPDRGWVRLSPVQVQSNQVFREAVAQARATIADPERKASIKAMLKSNRKTKYQSAYHFVIQEFMKEHQPFMKAAERQKVLEYYAALHPLSDRQVLLIELVLLGEPVSNKTHQQRHQVSKATATRDLRELVNWGIFNCSGKGAGAKYTLVLPTSKPAAE